MQDADLHALLCLIAAAGPTAPRRRLLDTLAPSAAWSAGPATWRGCGLTDAQVAAMQRPDEPRLHQAWAWLQQPGRCVLGWHDPDYPPLLRRAPHPPLALFVEGDAARLWHPAVAVVGSRSATPNGLDHARTFSRTLAHAGWGVASGMAAGIDTAAHEATLAAGGLTVAVLGTGPDVAYPRANEDLRARIAAEGVVVSEHLPGTGPRKEHFPSRNRILAGLTLATLVVEAAARSGALITARLAAEAGREVFALPGSIHNPMARGCHRLIRDGASLIEDAGEIGEALAPLAAVLASDLRGRLNGPTSTGHRVPAAASQASADDEPDYQNLWNALGHDPTDMDQLVSRTRLTTAEVSSMLLLMELDGRVASHHGRYFRIR
ncbi:DNA-processing protein DprA [Lysobacter niastensis]|uniref:DNA-protecting protein DprA n=1 Tax=Lysobacter niastensis TaxID=380629 RepID=A0ABS0B3F2_9GAMM|nr:DNA-processing protein DprA [Lysobacter niastensis]MBF6023006.1 DNA-protecting protein DprA [Lysobacter niastensis]